MTRFPKMVQGGVYAWWLGSWDVKLFKVSVRNTCILEQDLQWGLAAIEPGQNQVCFPFLAKENSLTPKMYSD